MKSVAPRTAILQDGQVAEIKLSYSQQISSENRIEVQTPEKAAEVFRSIWDCETIELRETFKIMLLNQGMQVLGIVTIAEGGINLLFADVRLIFATALKALSTRIITAHNHPTGRAIPSRSDILLSQRVVKIGKLLNIEVADQLIITREGFTSILDEQLVAQTLQNCPELFNEKTLEQ